MSGTSLSFMGWVIRNMATSWIVLKETNSMTVVGLVGALPSFVVLIVAPIGGSLSDKIDKTTLLIIGKGVAALASVLLAVCIIFYSSPLIITLCLFLALIAIGNGIELAANQNLFIDIVGEQNILRANSVGTFFNNLCNIIGPLIGSVLINSYSVFSLLWFFALTNFITLLLISLLRITPKAKDNADSDYTFSEGLKYINANSNLKILLLLGSTLMFWGFTQPILPKIADSILKIGGSGYGVLLAAGGLGGIFGAIFSGIFSHKIRNSKTLIISLFGNTVFMILFAFSSNYILSVILLAGTGFFASIWFLILTVLVQLTPSYEYRGRVVGLFHSILSLLGIGFILGGILGDIIGIKTALIAPYVAWFLIHFLVFLKSKEFRNLVI